MKRILIVILFFATALCTAARAFDQDTYLKLLEENDTLTTLEEFKETPGMIQLMMEHVEYINSLRARTGAQPVTLDILAGRVANMQATEAAELDFVGHWNTAGYKPYHRYGMYGGRDHVAENAYGSHGWFSGKPASESPCDMSDPDKMLAAMKQGADAFYAEGPGGGHYETLIDPAHNHVGLGLQCVNEMDGDRVTYRIRYYEEYVDRYVEFDLPDGVALKMNVGDTAKIDGHVLPQDTGAYVVLGYYEPFPQPMTPDQINSKSSYGDFTGDTAFSVWPWDLNFDPATRSFSFPFTPEKEGLYYIKVYVKEDIGSIPYKGGSADTKDSTEASGLIISVGRDG